MDTKARTRSKKKKEENEELKAKLDDALAHIKIVEGKLLGVLAKNKLASKREGAVNIGQDYIDTSIPIDVGMSEEVDVRDNNWTCYQFKSVDGNLEFIALNHGSNILRID